MRVQVIKALEAKVEDLHEQGVIYCDHGETEAVSGALVDAIRGLKDEDVIRGALRDAMYELYKQEMVFGQAHKAIADVVIEELGKL